MGADRDDEISGRLGTPALAGKEDIAFNPINIRMLSTDTIVLHPQLIADLVKQLGRICSGAFIRQIRGRHNFAPNKVNALHIDFQVIHLEGAFTGAF